MNIFVLDTDPVLAARYHCDKHVVKMILESCQLLSTYEHLEGNPEAFEIIYGTAPYKPSYIKHPCAIWLRQNRTHVAWLSKLALNLLLEYKHRYPHGSHACHDLVMCFWEKYHDYGDKTPETFALAMPDEYKPFVWRPSPEQCVQAYRNYYIFEKEHLHVYTGRPLPDWFPASKLNPAK